MEIKIVDEKKQFLKEGTENEYEMRVVNRIIGHPDHRGKIRWHTEDELRLMEANLIAVIKEVDKK